MTASIFTHGAGAILRHENTEFSLKVSEFGSIAKPNSPSRLTGAILFLIPSPPRNNPKVTAVDVSFSSQKARVDGVAINFANEEIFKKSNLQKGNSFGLELGSQATMYSSSGIVVTVYVKFENSDSSINFESVGVTIACES